MQLGLITTTRVEPGTSADANTIIGTQPTAGTRLAPGSDITLFKSSGPVNITVPHAEGYMLADAQRLVEGLPYSLQVVVQYTHNSSVPVGMVLSTSPAAGASVAPGSTVIFTVAN